MSWLAKNGPALLAHPAKESGLGAPAFRPAPTEEDDDGDKEDDDGDKEDDDGEEAGDDEVDDDACVG